MSYDKIYDISYSYDFITKICLSKCYFKNHHKYFMLAIYDLKCIWSLSFYKLCKHKKIFDIHMYF